MSWICIFAPQSVGAEIPLYPTGPSEDSAFVRFANASGLDVDMHVTASKVIVKLGGTHPSTEFYPVRANTEIRGEFEQGNEQARIAVSLKPGEFVTVVARTIDKKLSQIIFRESPEDFNALKASIALYNADPACRHADLRVAGRSVLLFEAVAADALQRRSVNPVKLSVELFCDGKLEGAALNLGQLQAGGRYTILVGRSGQHARINFASDAVAK